MAIFLDLAHRIVEWLRKYCLENKENNILWSMRVPFKFLIIKERFKHTKAKIKMSVRIGTIFYESSPTHCFTIYLVSNNYLI